MNHFEIIGRIVEAKDMAQEVSEAITALEDAAEVDEYQTLMAYDEVYRAVLWTNKLLANLQALQEVVQKKNESAP